MLFRSTVWAQRVALGFWRMLASPLSALGVPLRACNRRSVIPKLLYAARGNKLVLQELTSVEFDG